MTDLASEAGMALSGDWVEAVERATLASVPPRELLERPGWLIPFDDGRIGRSQALVPLSHSEAAEDAGIALIDEWLALCRTRGQVPTLRLPQQGMERLKAALSARGMGPKDDAIDVQTVTVDAALAACGQVIRTDLPEGYRLELQPQPTDAWGQVFLGPGFDPVEGASRVEILSRAQHAVYATVFDAQQDPVACGTCVRRTHVGTTWAGIHGMRTLAQARRQGLAARLIHAMLVDARAHGASDAFLQVESSNTPAVTLYQRLGFEPAWVYRYWRFDGPRGY
jgi:N-acetylglutamate synthase